MLAPGIDPRLERAILEAISRDPRDRPATALEMAAALPVAGTAPSATTAAGDVQRVAGRRRGRRRWSWQPLRFIWSRAAGGTLTAHDTIILADFLNTTGDPVFDSTLKVALAVALEQSPFLKVFPDERAHEALRLMQRSPSERITRATRARDRAT